MFSPSSTRWRPSWAPAVPFLTGAAFTEADIRLFVTLVRFDAAYYGLFKTNLRRAGRLSGIVGPCGAGAGAARGA